MIENLEKKDELNLTKKTISTLLKKYGEDEDVRNKAQKEWDIFKPTFESIELLRMNLAKHAAPGKGNVFSPMPGYARIHQLCGSLTFQVVDQHKNLIILSRRDLAEELRYSFKILRNEQGTGEEL